MRQAARRLGVVAKLPARLASKADTPGIEHQPTLRALMLYESLPAGHSTFLVTEDSSEPHLREGEYAVIDMLDHELLHGELYLYQSKFMERRRRIVQARQSYCNITGGDEDTLVWWLRDLRGYRKTDKRMFGCPVYAGLSDGPFLPEGLQSYLLGRVVGYAPRSLDRLMAPEAGWVDEAAGNAAFDPAEYVDVFLATDHGPFLYGDMYFEKTPERALSDEEKERVLAVRRKYVVASKALERVK